MRSRTLISAFLFLLLVFFPSGAGSAAEVNEGLPEIRLEIGTSMIAVEVASTPEQRRIGLMNRKSMPEDRGMLFVYERPERVAFWMKNTYIPLSAAFIAADGTVVKIADMAPLSETHHSPDVPVKYVLEVNRGVLRKANLRVGDTLPIEAKLKAF